MAPTISRCSSFARYNKTMHPPSRTRRILKWTGVGLSALVLTAWIASCVWYVSWCGYRDVIVHSGGVYINFWPGSRQDYEAMELWQSGGLLAPKYELRHGRVNEPFLKSIQRGFHYPSVSKRAPFSRNIGIPFWVIFLPTAIFTIVLFRRDRRRIPPGHCSRCGYDLTGNLSGVCSECGERSGTRNEPGNHPT